MVAPRPTGRFPAARRVRRRLEFQAIQSRGRRVVTPRFVLLLYARAAAVSAGARLGITVSRRVGTAVVRNRAKRLIREAFRRTQELWPADIDVVVIARQPPGMMKMQEVIAEWEHARKWIMKRIEEARRDRGVRELASQRETTHTSG